MNKNDSFNDTRNEFNRLYDEAVNDILFLKDCNISINQIHDITNYQIDFIVYYNFLKYSLPVLECKISSINASLYPIFLISST